MFNRISFNGLIVFSLFLNTSDAFSSQIDSSFSVNLLSNVQVAMVHDSQFNKSQSRTTLKEELEILKLMEKYYKNPMLLNLIRSLNSTELGITFIPWNINFQLTGDYILNPREDLSFGAHIELDNSIKWNNTSMKLPNTENEFPGRAYTFIGSPKFGRFEFGYADSTSSTMMINTNNIGVGGYGVQGNWVNYVHLRDIDSTVLGYTYDSKFWVKQSLFTDYLDLKSALINYRSPSFSGFTVGLTYLPGTNPNKQFVLNEDRELIDVLHSKDIAGGAALYTLKSKQNEISISIAAETSTIVSEYKHSFRQFGVAAGTKVKLGSLEFAATVGFPKFSNEDLQFNTEYMALGVTYIGTVKKIGISGFTSSNNGNILQAIAIDFESKINTNLLNFDSEETDKKIPTDNYLNSCSYYIEIVGFQTKEMASTSHRLVEHNSGYLLVLGLKASF